MSFNPRSRTGNDTAQGQWANNILTFQSTFPHGERPIRIEKIDETTGFQSTFPHGERRRVEEGSGHNGTVSIHVPARGTTKKSYKGDYDKLRFNPRSRTGNDHGLIALIKPYYLGFNPRSRTGNDPIGDGGTENLEVSIHVPARGTTKKDLLNIAHIAVSIHVPARGTTLCKRHCP